MNRTSEANSGGAEARTEGKKNGKAEGDRGEAAPGARRRGQGDGDESGIDAAEHLQQDFARVRAKAATDPTLATRTLSAAWTNDGMNEGMEEDEAEFVDAVADCLGAGFSLESALTGWDMGTLAADGLEDASLFDDDDGEREDEDAVAAAPALDRRHTPSGRRVIVT